MFGDVISYLSKLDSAFRQSLKNVEIFVSKIFKNKKIVLKSYNLQLHLSVVETLLQLSKNMICQ